MKGYTFEMWTDATQTPALSIVRVTDPYDYLIGEVKSLTEETSLRLAHELKKNDRNRFRADHGIFS
jgi:hypothetical protein